MRLEFLEIEQVRFWFQLEPKSQKKTEPLFSSLIENHPCIGALKNPEINRLIWNIKNLLNLQKTL